MSEALKLIRSRAYYAVLAHDGTIAESDSRPALFLRLPTAKGYGGRGCRVEPVYCIPVSEDNASKPWDRYHPAIKFKVVHVERHDGEWLANCGSMEDASSIQRAETICAALNRPPDASDGMKIGKLSFSVSGPIPEQTRQYLLNRATEALLAEAVALLQDLYYESHIADTRNRVRDFLARAISATSTDTNKEE